MGGDLFERLHVPSPGNTSLVLLAKWLRFEQRVAGFAVPASKRSHRHAFLARGSGKPPAKNRDIVLLCICRRDRSVVVLVGADWCCGRSTARQIDHRICLAPGKPETAANAATNRRG